MVFGKVQDAESMAVVTAVEAVGCQGGSTEEVVTITDCGQLSTKEIKEINKELGDKKKD